MTYSPFVESVIEAYYTPNVRFEILLGILLRPCLAALVNDQCGLATEFVASELPFQDKQAVHGNAGAKADFLLADARKAYWVELKTGKDHAAGKSGHGKRQYLRYKEALKTHEDFGKASGDRLLTILKGCYGLRSLAAPYGDNSVQEAFRLITGASAESPAPVREAIAHLKKTGGTASRKYLLTLAGLLAYLKTPGNTGLWAKKPGLIYITPTGREMLPDVDDACWQPARETASVSLVAGIPLLRQHGHTELAEVISALFQDGE